MNLSELQAAVNARWAAQLDNPCHDSGDRAHVMLHVDKASGAIASALNDAKHERRDVRPEEVSKYLADLVICAMQIADGVVDMDAAVRDRMRVKFPNSAQVSGESKA